MRHARWNVGPFALAALAAACTGSPREGLDDGTRDAPAVDVPGPPAPTSPCGDAGEPPPRTARDDASHTVTVECDGDAKALAVTLFDDGIVRLRYGDDARGSIVPVDPPAAKAPLRAGRRGDAVVVCGAELEVTVEPGRCTLSIASGGDVVVADGEGGGFFRDGADVGVARASPEGERFYGLGLHTAAGNAKGLDLRGSVIELYNTDAYDGAAGGFRPDAPRLYESIPFYVGLRGKTAYGVFTDETRRMFFDLAKSDPGRVRVKATSTARLDQYVFAGPRIADVVRRYTRLTGRAPLPAPWALGFHQSRWEGPCEGSPAERPFCSAAQIAAVAQRFRDARIPADGVFLDIQHMDGFRTFTFDPARFADPEGLSTQLEALGFKTQIIVDPGIKIDPAYDVYASGLAGGHFLRTPAGAPYEGEVWPGPSVFPDFTREATRGFWSGLVAAAAKRGIRGMWIDMNEPSSFTTGTVPDEVLADGDGRATTMAEAHNAYAWFEAKATYEGMKAARPDERPFVLSRAAFAGQQRYSAVWTGDAPSTWTTLAATLPQLLHLGVSGMAFAGSDVGGYSGRAESTAELFGRWMALGAVSPFFRAHAERDARRQEPWAFGPEVEDATRALVSLRYELMPYLYSAFEETTRTGAPVLRPLVFDYQDDEATHAIADAAMLGPELLVAPALAPGAAERAVYLPGAGRWFDLRSGAAHAGGKVAKISAAPDKLPLDALPIFAREGAIVPRAEVTPWVGHTTGGPLFVDVFPAAPETTTYALYEDDGRAQPSASRVTFTLGRTPNGVRFSAARDGAAGAFAKHARVVARFRRVDHDPSNVTANGAPLARVDLALAKSASAPASSFAYDPVDRTAIVVLPDAFPFSVDVAYDEELEPDGDVAVPLTVKLPPGTPGGTAIHVASSAAAWAHAPLSRVGDVATGTIAIPRGRYAFFKITRGDWPTVEKAGGCLERPNRHAFGAAEPIAIEVAGWADLCP